MALAEGDAVDATSSHSSFHAKLQARRPESVCGLSLSTAFRGLTGRWYPRYRRRCSQSAGKCWCEWGRSGAHTAEQKRSSSAFWTTCGEQRIACRRISWS